MAGRSNRTSGACCASSSTRQVSSREYRDPEGPVDLVISQRVLPEDFWAKVPASHDNGDVVGQFVTDPDKPLLHRLILSGVSTQKRDTRIDAQNRVAGSSISCSVARGWWATAVTGRSRLGNGFIKESAHARI